MATATKKKELIAANFQVARETKGSIVFNELDDKGQPMVNEKGYADLARCKIGTIYIRKTALGNPVPSIIRITVETAA